jgi:hypothetical protein
MEIPREGSGGVPDVSGEHDRRVDQEHHPRLHEEADGAIVPAHDGIIDGAGAGN